MTPESVLEPPPPSPAPTTATGSPAPLGAAKTPPTLPVFSRAHVDRILTAAAPGEVHVLVAPPGSGKSVHTREALAPLVLSGTVERVLWATHAMVSSSSLGQEAADHFTRLKVPNQIVLGSEDFVGTKPQYRAQFAWSAAGPEVKVISHVRVGQIFSPVSHPAQTLADAQLLVIDEDPLQSLTLHRSAERTSKPLKISDLAHTGHPVGAALLHCAHQASTSAELRDHKNAFDRVTGHYLQGRGFWRDFHDAHPAPIDTRSLTAALRSLRVAEASLIAQAFAEDVAEASRASHAPPERFGLDWNAAATPETAALRYDVRVPLAFNCPVIILDGYAEEAHYRALFPEHTVLLHHFDPGAPLNVACASLLHVDSRREHTPKQAERRKQIADEIALFAQASMARSPSRAVLVITGKKLTTNHSQWQYFLTVALKHHGLTLGKEVQLQHWLAGRGKNAFAGLHVIALTRPRLNKRFTDFTLTALYPTDAVRRAVATRELLAAETLQMLHRGRQGAFPGPHPPQVIFAESIKNAAAVLRPLENRVHLHEYSSILNFEAGSHLPRWQDALIALATELLTLFPNGLPRVLLQGLPILSTSSARTNQVREQLQTLAAGQPTDGHLYRAFHAKSTWKYHDVKPAGGDNSGKTEEKVLVSMGLRKRQGKRQGRGPVIYVPEGKDPNDAQADVEKWLETGVTPTIAPPVPLIAPAAGVRIPAAELPTSPEG